MKADLTKKIFLYEFEDVKKEFYTNGFWGIAGLISIIFGLRKGEGKKNNSTQ
jgi:hypothetical protein